MCYKLVPARCTDFCQPMDLSVNRILKSHLRKQWTTWYGQQLMLQLKRGVALKDVKVDTTLTYLKPIHAGWVLVPGRKQGKTQQQ